MGGHSLPLLMGRSQRAALLFPSPLLPPCYFLWHSKGTILFLEAKRASRIPRSARVGVDADTRQVLLAWLPVLGCSGREAHPQSRLCVQLGPGGQLGAGAKRWLVHGHSLPRPRAARKAGVLRDTKGEPRGQSPGVVVVVVCFHGPVLGEAEGGEKARLPHPCRPARPVTACSPP